MTKIEENPNGLHLLELKHVFDCLLDINSSVRITAQPLLEKSLSNVFTGHKQIRAYELSNSTRGTREIAEMVGAGQKTISRWFVAWEKAGIVEKVGSRGQYQKKFTLMDLITMKNEQKWLFLESADSEEREE